MKNLMTNLVLKKIALVGLVSCSSAALVGGVVVPHFTAKEDLASDNAVLQKEVKKEATIDTRKDLEVETEDDILPLEAFKVLDINASKEELSNVKDENVPKEDSKEVEVPSKTEVEIPQEEEKEEPVVPSPSTTETEKEEELETSSKEETEEVKPNLQEEVEEENKEEVKVETTEEVKKEESKENNTEVKENIKDEEKEPSLEVTEPKQEETQELSKNEPQFEEKEFEYPKEPGELENKKEETSKPVENEAEKNDDVSDEVEDKSEVLPDVKENQEEVKENNSEVKDNNTEVKDDIKDEKESKEEVKDEDQEETQELPKNEPQFEEKEFEYPKEPGELENKKEETSKPEEKVEEKNEEVSDEVEDKSEVLPDVKEGQEEVPSEQETKPNQEDDKEVPVLPNTSDEEVEKEDQVTPQEEEKETVNYQLIELIETALNNTKALRSVYYSQYQDGYGTMYIKYNKDQNRLLYEDRERQILEYEEGITPYCDDTNNVCSFKDRWSKVGTNDWEKQPSLRSAFGISRLAFLNKIKDVQFLADRENGGHVFPLYRVTLDKDFANSIAVNEFSRVNMFKSDVKVEVSLSIDKKYIKSLILDFDSSVLNDEMTSGSDIFAPLTKLKSTIYIDGYNKTSVDRPKGLNVVLTEHEEPNKFTQSVKEEIKAKIEAAAHKTIYDVNNATYEFDGLLVKYDKVNNKALFKDSNGETYYEGFANQYLDYYYATPLHIHQNWTKATGSLEWKQNPSKQKLFTANNVLMFLDHVFDCTEPVVQNGVTIYTVTILKYNANLAYSEVYGVNNKFNDNVTLQVTLDDEGYIKTIYGNFGDRELNLRFSDINKTEVTRPSDLVVEND